VVLVMKRCHSPLEFGCNALRANRGGVGDEVVIIVDGVVGIGDGVESDESVGGIDGGSVMTLGTDFVEVLSDGGGVPAASSITDCSAELVTIAVWSLI